MILQFILAVLMFFSVFGTGNDHHEKEHQGNPIRIKVAAYNVEYGRVASAEEIGEALKPYHFDIVCFSEAPGGDWTRKVANVLGLSHVVVGRYSTFAQKDKYKSIVSRTPLYDYENILMLDTLHTATKAKTIINGKELAIYAVHFPFGWRNANHIIRTTEKIDLFANYLKSQQHDEISIVMGDFNLTLNSPHYQMLKYAGLESVWEDLGRPVDQQSSMVKNTHGHVIDHVMYNPKNVKALDGQIMELKKPLSDHKPVWALLQLK